MDTAVVLSRRTKLMPIVTDTNVRWQRLLKTVIMKHSKGTCASIGIAASTFADKKIISTQ